MQGWSALPHARGLASHAAVWDSPFGSMGDAKLATGRQRRLGVIVSGATGGLVAHQHLPALLAIRREGGVPLANGDRAVPDLLLVGRDASKVARTAISAGIERWTDDLDTALSSNEHQVFFDATATALRSALVSRALAAGKHVYCEKPLASTLADAMALVRMAAERRLCNGVVQDKILMPGMRKLKRLKEQGFFGRILEVRLEFSRWIFDGATRPAQRPTWNYRKRDGGGLILDMFPHWRYLIEHLAGGVRTVSCTARTQIPRRYDERGQRYDVDVEDAAFAHLELDGGAIASVNSSWTSRIRREDVITIQIDGTHGSAVAGLHDCYTQTDAATPKVAITVDERQPQSFHEQWQAIPDDATWQNSYRAGWDMFIRHVLIGTPFPSPFLEGAKGVQLAELSHLSNRERRWVEVPPLA
jgi:predicted dehydrogenase